MAEYKVINSFYDKEDNDTHYNVGDIYPKTDAKPSKERIEKLSKKHPEHKVAFIEKVISDDAEETEKEGIKAELESMGVSYHPNTGLEKLREKLEEAKTENKE
jgi:hypothetical protein